MSAGIRIPELLSLKLKREGIFTDRMIFNLVFPIFLQQAVLAVVKVANTVMVAYVGETAVAGISVITTVDSLINTMMNALAIGGSVVVSQYIGVKNIEKGCTTVKNSFYCILAISTSLCLILFACHVSFLRLLTGDVQPEVFQNARVYFAVELFSYPFYALFCFASATYRAMAKTRMVMLCTVVMTVSDLLLKALFIYTFKLGVLGAGLSTLISTAVIGVYMVITLCNPCHIVYIKKILELKFDFSIVKRILGIGIPNSIENGMFQFGLLALQRLTASFGTVALAANAIAKDLGPISYVVSSSFKLAIVTIIGQCMGAGEHEQAVMYTKHVLKINYILGFVINLACIILCKPLVGMFNMSPETNKVAERIFILYCTGAILLYPLSFVLPDALRGAGDTKYMMVVSTASMFGMRIGMAFVLGSWMGLGVFGVWLAMQLDWISRSAFNIVRFLRGKWKTIKVI